MLTTDLIVTLPGDSSKQQEEGVVGPHAPVVAVHTAVPSRSLGAGKLLLVDVGNRLVGYREGQGKELKRGVINLSTVYLSVQAGRSKASSGSGLRDVNNII